MLIIYTLLFIIFMILYNSFMLTYRAFYRIKINNILENIEQKEDLLYLSFKDFISLVSIIYKKKGYKVEFTKKCGEDSNGLVLNELIYVEIFKHSFNHLLEIETAMKLARCMQKNAVYKGIIITLGDFKESTRLFCHKNVIECINCEQLLQMCKEVRKKIALTAD